MTGRKIKKSIEKCSVFECPKNASRTKNGSYRKICIDHFIKRHGKKPKSKKRLSSQNIREKLRKTLDTNKCSICSWIGPCDIHRKIPGFLGGKYTFENIMVVCPNCHRLEHRKGIYES